MHPTHAPPSIEKGTSCSDAYCGIAICENMTKPITFAAASEADPQLDPKMAGTCGFQRFFAA